MLSKLLTIAYRDLIRNRRRSVFTLIAVAIGLALIITMNGLIEGALEGAMRNNIRLKTGHAQVRAESYPDGKLSLKWQDLIDNADELSAQVNGMSEVKAAAPVLWATGILYTIDETVGLQVYGIETTSPIYDPIREAMVTGDFITDDDRSGILIGKRLAEQLGVGVEQKVSLSVGTADGPPDEGIFTIRGIFSTGNLFYDEHTIFLPLSKAQAFTHTSGRASSIMIMLHQQDDADKVAATLKSPGLATFTWEDLNQLLLTTIQQGMAFYVIMYAIVIMVVAVVIVNTLLMSVFERVREMGILAALGMKGRQIMTMVLMESVILGLAGVVIGIILGSAYVVYLSKTGIYIGEVSASVDVGYGTVMYARWVLANVLSLSGWTFAIILLGSLYPAWFAARLAPVEALHNL